MRHIAYSYGQALRYIFINGMRLDTDGYINIGNAKLKVQDFYFDYTLYPFMLYNIDGLENHNKELLRQDT